MQHRIPGAVLCTAEDEARRQAAADMEAARQRAAADLVAANEAAARLREVASR